MTHNKTIVPLSHFIIEGIGNYFATLLKGYPSIIETVDFASERAS